jgi:hypothetical protein
VYRLLRGHYSPVIAPTDSCVNPVWLSSTSAFGLVRGVFAGCYQPLLLPGFSRRYFCESFPRCPSPYPGGLLSAFAWFFLSIHRPSPSFDWVGFPLPSVNTTFHGAAFEAAAISLCSGLRVCSIGIERGRASRRGRFSILALSVCKVGSQFPHSHVSRGPPIIPDGRVSQVRFEVLACRQ